MYRYLLKILLLCILSLTMPNIALAIDYTTKKKNYQEEKASNDVKKECSRNDLRIIKKFNYKAKLKIEEFNDIDMTALSEDNVMPTKRTQEDALELSEEITKVTNFFKSDEFKEMEVIYKRCNIEAPKLNQESLFWLPLNEENKEEEETENEGSKEKSGH